MMGPRVCLGNSGINSGKSAVFSGKICPRESPRVIRLSKGRSPEGKSDDSRESPRVNFSDNTEDFPLFFRLLD